jgi:hypothetical protein
VSLFLDRHFQKVMPEPNSGCWFWMGTINWGGYGTIRVSDGRNRVVHRVAYETDIGPVPDGLVLDHLCRVRCCCNPQHLEAVTHLENVRRGLRCSANRGNGLCAQGHDYEANKIFRRGAWCCRECRLADKRKWARSEAGRKSHREAQARWIAKQGA